MKFEKIDEQVSTIAAICSRAVGMASSGGFNDEAAGQLLQSKEDIEQVTFQLLDLTQYIYFGDFF